MLHPLSRTISGLGLLSTLLVHILHLACAYNQNPKLYVDIDCIKFIDPLLHGFNIHLPSVLVNEYLDSHHLPVIYISAVPLRAKKRDDLTDRQMLPQQQQYSASLPPSDVQPLRKILYTEEIIDKVVTLGDLHEQSWYYVCVEFENMHRRQRHGNTSTTCELHRTLDRFGKKADSTLGDVSLTTITPYSLEFQLGISADFPLFLDVYLSDGPSPFQRYFVDGGAATGTTPDRSIRISFNNLAPDTSYGSLCVRQSPLTRSYTAMGRTIAVENDERCYLKALRTAPEPLITEVSAYSQAADAAYVRSSRDARNGGLKTGAGPDFVSISFIALLLNSIYCDVAAS